MVYTLDKKVIDMKTVGLPYEERDVDLDEIREIANASLKRIQKDREEMLIKAIKNHDSYYIGRELSNVSSYELLKMMINKLWKKIKKTDLHK